ncbi:tetratricopeptide repeat-containing diguanylate cyclase [Aliikangiella coralliicola]|uniref:diguanylate cyclase n=1 Tax=Aliikangiella coralliicola TaxID=2592383 RepID=A0A545U4W9_9GAMM|nr:GGDEF domain-containing protein [Aliikangiella coralliicola]TQV84509.1 GGDEF domain-containing protein [Aliikangiella coralliicola]
MRIVTKWLCCLSLSLCLLGDLAAAEVADIDLLLKNADLVKSSDKTQFSSLVQDLETKFEKMSIRQKYFFLYLSGYKSAYSGDVPKAIKHYMHVFDNSTDNELRYRVSLSLVNLYAFRREWAEGYKFIDVIEKLKDRIYDNDVKTQGLIAAGVFYNEVENFQQTHDYMSSIIQEGVSGRNLCMASGLKLNAELSLKKSVISEEKFNDAIKLCLQSNEKLIANVIRSYLGMFYLDENLSEKAINVILPYLEEIEKSGYQLLIKDTYSILAEAYWLENKLDLSEKYALLSIENNSDRATKIRPIVNAYRLLYKIYFKKNEFEKTVTYLEELLEAEKIHFSDLNAKQLAIESAKRYSAEKDNQIALLNKQNEILQLEKELSEETATYNKWIIGLLILSVSLLITWMFYVKRSQQRLKYLAEYDSLTGICNRAHFTQSTEDVLEYLSKSGRSASLILFDLDNFKKINDTYGHPAGDEVLRLAAGSCKDSVRKVDIFGRVGGEEFALLLPGCDIEQAHKIADECRIRISEMETSITGYDFDVSASFGIADTKSSGYLLKDITANADEAMYLAKRRGRNRVVVHAAE